MTPRQPILKTRTAREHELRRRIEQCEKNRELLIDQDATVEAENQRRRAVGYLSQLKALGAR